MDNLIDELIRLAFAEDIGDGDHTIEIADKRSWRVGRRGDGSTDI